MRKAKEQPVMPPCAVIVDAKDAREGVQLDMWQAVCVQLDLDLDKKSN